MGQGGRDKQAAYYQGLARALESDIAGPYGEFVAAFVNRVQEFFGRGAANAKAL